MRLGGQALQRHRSPSSTASDSVCTDGYSIQTTALLRPKVGYRGCRVCDVESTISVGGSRYTRIRLVHLPPYHAPALAVSRSGLAVSLSPRVQLLCLRHLSNKLSIALHGVKAWRPGVFPHLISWLTCKKTAVR